MVIPVNPNGHFGANFQTAPKCTQSVVADPIWLQDEEGFSSSSDDDEKEGGKGSKGSKEVV